MLSINHCNEFLKRSFDECWLEKANVNSFSVSASRSLTKICEFKRGMYSSVIVEYEKELQDGYESAKTYLMSFQFAVSLLPSCPFPNRRSVYCYFIDFSDLISGYDEILNELWWSDSWMKLGCDLGEINDSLETLSDICRIALPIFQENSLKQLNA